MPQPHFYLSTDFSLPAGLPTAHSEVREVTITATSLCIGRATRVCGEIEATLLNGAVPDAQLVMARHVGEARQKGIPLTCVLSMGS